MIFCKIYKRYLNNHITGNNALHDSMHDDRHFFLLFRFLGEMPKGSTFIAFAFIIRIVTAMGSACSQVAILSVMSITFKENMSTVFVRDRFIVTHFVSVLTILPSISFSRNITEKKFSYSNIYAER